MTKELLQSEDIPAVHHEMAGERVPQNVGELAVRHLQLRLCNAFAESRIGVNENPLVFAMLFVVRLQRLFKIFCNWHGARLAGFGFDELDNTITHLGNAQLFGFPPTERQ